MLLQKYAYNYCLCSIVICGDSTDPVALQYGPGSHADMIGAMHLVLQGEAAGGAPHASLPLPPRSSLASLESDQTPEIARPQSGWTPVDTHQPRSVDVYRTLPCGQALCGSASWRASWRRPCRGGRFRRRRRAMHISSGVANSAVPSFATQLVRMRGWVLIDLPSRACAECVGAAWRRGRE